MKNTYLRWHRMRSDGKKEIRRFAVDYVPVNDPEQGEWRRGTGPITGAALERLREGVRKACLGVPKPPEQREKMRLAKLGKPKTPEHRRNMSLGHRRRLEQLREAQHVSEE